MDYTNAWYSSLAEDSSGGLWGVWNQHYPITLGVCSGDLVEDAAPVTKDLAAYPSLAVDGSGTRWVIWESYLKDLLRGKPHRILAASHAGGDKWSLPEDLSSSAGTKYNQTPKAAVDAGGAVWVAWSGRADDGDPWGIYVCHSVPGGWSDARLMSAAGETARAPAISAGEDGIWLAWHSGIGDEMQTKVLRRHVGEGH
jgi:hypothetical protein